MRSGWNGYMIEKTHTATSRALYLAVVGSLGCKTSNQSCKKSDLFNINLNQFFFNLNYFWFKSIFLFNKQRSIIIIKIWFSISDCLWMCRKYVISPVRFVGPTFTKLHPNHSVVDNKCRSICLLYQILLTSSRYKLLAHNNYFVFLIYSIVLSNSSHLESSCVEVSFSMFIHWFCHKLPLG